MVAVGEAKHRTGRKTSDQGTERPRRRSHDERQRARKADPQRVTVYRAEQDEHGNWVKVERIPDSSR